jgi:hypothetical protein
MTNGAVDKTRQDRKGQDRTLQDMKWLNIRGRRAEDWIEEKERRRRLLTISTICSPHLALNFVPIAAVTISRSSCNMRESTVQYRERACKMRESTVQWYSVVQCSAVQYSTVQYSNSNGEREHGAILEVQ